MQILANREVEMLAVIANKVDPLQAEALHVLFEQRLPKSLLTDWRESGTAAGQRVIA